MSSQFSLVRCSLTVKDKTRHIQHIQQNETNETKTKTKKIKRKICDVKDETPIYGWKNNCQVC